MVQVSLHDFTPQFCAFVSTWPVARPSTSSQSKAVLRQKQTTLPAKAKWLWVKTNGIPFWDRCTTHFRTYFSGDWDVHWGCDLGFDPWPNSPKTVRQQQNPAVTKAARDPKTLGPETQAQQTRHWQRRAMRLAAVIEHRHVASPMGQKAVDQQ